MKRKNEQTRGDYTIIALPDTLNSEMKITVKKGSKVVLQDTFYANAYDCGFFRSQAEWEDFEEFLTERHVPLPWRGQDEGDEQQQEEPLDEMPVDINLSDFPVVRGYVRDGGKVAVHASTGGVSIMYLASELPKPALDALAAAAAERDKTIAWLVEWWHAVRTMEIRAGGHVHRFLLTKGKIKKIVTK